MVFCCNSSNAKIINQKGKKYSGQSKEWQIIEVKVIEGKL
jgi:hypothetical protein